MVSPVVFTKVFCPHYLGWGHIRWKLCCLYLQVLNNRLETCMSEHTLLFNDFLIQLRTLHGSQFRGMRMFPFPEKPCIG